MASTATSPSDPSTTTAIAAPAASDQSYLSSFVPTMLTDLVQSAADLVQQAAQTVQTATEMVVGPPAPVAKEASPVPGRIDSAPPPPPLDDTTPKASRIQPVDPNDAATTTAAAAAPSKRASMFNALTTTMLNLGSLSSEPQVEAKAPAEAGPSSPSSSPSPSPRVVSPKPKWDGLPLRTASPTPSMSSIVSRQLTAEGTPFSSDPLISAMQRIPDGPSPCLSSSSSSSFSSFSSIPPSPMALPRSDTFSSVASSTISIDEKGVERCEACSCKRRCKTWHVVLPVSSPAKAAGNKDEPKGDQGGEQGEMEKPHTCPCTHHLTKMRKNLTPSHHFHRVQQVVKGTKRVARDIRNVL